MPTITKPPILAATAFMDRSNQNTQFVGAQALVKIGSNLYAGLSNNSTPAFGVFKSTDGGLTWTQRDAVHAPALLFFPSYEVIAAQDGIYFVWDGDGGAVASQAIGYCRFDPLTDTWGAVHASPALMTAAADRLAIARRSNGDIVVIFTSLNPVANDLQFGIFSKATGAWGGANNFFNTVSGISFGVAAVVGPDNTVYVLSQDGAGPTQIFFQTISPGNVVSAQLLIATIGAGEIVPGLPVIWNNQLIFPFTALGGGNPSMFVGTPVGSPVWSNVALSLVTPLADVFTPIAFVTPQNALLVFVSLNGGIGAPPYQIWFSTFGLSALSAPTGLALYYDAVTDPPVAGPVDEILKVSLIPFNGSIAGMVGMQQGGGGFPPENAYFLLPGCPTNAQGN